MFGNKIVVGPIRCPVSRHTIRLRRSLHDPHCRGHLAPLRCRQSSHLPTDALRRACRRTAHRAFDSRGRVSSHLKTKQYLVVLLQVRRPDHLRPTLGQYRLRVQAFTFLHSHSFAVRIFCRVDHRATTVKGQCRLSHRARRCPTAARSRVPGWGPTPPSFIRGVLRRRCPCSVHLEPSSRPSCRLRGSRHNASIQVRGTAPCCLGCCSRTMRDHESAPRRSSHRTIRKLSHQNTIPDLRRCGLGVLVPGSTRIIHTHDRELLVRHTIPFEGHLHRVVRREGHGILRHQFTIKPKLEIVVAVDVPCDGLRSTSRQSALLVGVHHNVGLLLGDGRPCGSVRGPSVRWASVRRGGPIWGAPVRRPPARRLRDNDSIHGDETTEHHTGARAPKHSQTILNKNRLKALAP
mmetsp:Transcript_50263/g.114195  ORF Transcript_50263/g.114195 Transcript_50263/m.114195 type:complete len:405 (+) Transcript_50263:1189-2403(+)